MPHQRPTTPVSSSRRTFFSGVATVGATAVAATALPKMVTKPAEVNALPSAPENGGGYSLSEHVKRYYKTTLV